MTDQFAQTIIPWLVGILVTLFALSSSLTVKFWRESKRSPYYFLRRQAEQNMQTYSFATLGLAVTLLFVLTYSWQGPQDTTMRVALMTNAKSAYAAQAVSETVIVEEDVVVEEPSPEVVVLRDLPVITGVSGNVADGDLVLAGEPQAETSNPVDEEPALPPEFDRFDPEAQLTAETEIGTLNFCKEVDDALQPVEPQRLFKEGAFTIYATFDYAQMADGMAWSWVWRHDERVVSGGNELWAYGETGPGYVYLNPEEGFQPGQYTVEIWVNGELMGHSNLFVTADVAANN